VFALADEAAPMIADESRAVARVLGAGARTFDGPAATLEAFRRAAAESRVLHVATHGMFRRDEPGLSCVRLADGWLHAYDVRDLEVRSELVVLSACESAVSAVTAGDEPLGLVRAFLVAGASRVLAARWRVHDASTAQFMTAFHGALAAGHGAEAALRIARSTVRASHPHPYHWAAFSLVGHPGCPEERGLTETSSGARPEAVAAGAPARRTR
jgi:CHAT domain-containing protein